MDISCYLFLRKLSYSLVALAIATLGLFSCDNAPIDSNEKNAIPEEEYDYSSIITKMALPILSTPGGAELKVLPRRSALTLTGQYSQHLFPIYRTNDTLYQPYLEVVSNNETVGWVYADPNNFDLTEEEFIWRAQHWISVLLGEKALQEVLAINKIWIADTGVGYGELVMAYRTACYVRDRLEEEIQRRGYRELPLKIAQVLLPGFNAYRQPDGYLKWWTAFPAWAERAHLQQDAEALQVFEFYYQLYPQDSIEYHFPSWRFPISSMQSHSLLGRGVHLHLLRQLHGLQGFSSLAASAIEDLQEQLLSDILMLDNTYWEDCQTVQNEIQEIINQEPPIVSPNTIIQLRKHLEAPVAQMSTRCGKKNG